MLSTEKSESNPNSFRGFKICTLKGESMLTSLILALIKLLSNPVLVAALAKFLANALKTVS